MRNIIKIIAFTIMALSIGAITGCTDFPDEYAVDASVGEIRMKDDAKLSEDGKSYTTTVLVDFDIKENTFGKISSAIVYINGTEYDVVGQLDHNAGGTAEIPCTFEYNEYISVKATLKVAAHSYDNKKGFQPRPFTNDVNLSTGNADGITPCSAVLHIDANYPWLMEDNALYMLVSPEQFNIPVNAKIDDFNGQVLRCTKTGSDYAGYNIGCCVKNLSAKTTYYYQMVRLDSESKVSFAGETKSFNTTEATAWIYTSMDGLSMIYACVRASLSPGNLSGLYTSDWRVKSYLGESQEKLEEYSVEKFPPYSGNTIDNWFRGLNASSKYYYRLDFYIGDGFMCSSGIKEFTTAESTAALAVSKTEIFDTYARIGVTLDKGNTTILYDQNKATVEICYGESKDQMLLKQEILVNNSQLITFNLNDLRENKKYYYKVCYCLNGSVLASSDILEFTTYKSADFTNIGSLEIKTGNNDSSGNKDFLFNVRKGTVLAFHYSINQGSHSLYANLTGASNVSLLKEHSSQLNWTSGNVYYVFTESGPCTLTLSYAAHHYGTIVVPEIKLKY